MVMLGDVGLDGVKNAILGCFDHLRSSGIICEFSRSGVIERGILLLQNMKASNFWSPPYLKQKLDFPGENTGGARRVFFPKWESQNFIHYKLGYKLYNSPPSIRQLSPALLRSPLISPGGMADRFLRGCLRGFEAAYCNLDVPGFPGRLSDTWDGSNISLGGPMIPNCSYFPWRLKLRNHQPVSLTRWVGPQEQGNLLEVLASWRRSLGF